MTDLLPHPALTERLLAIQGRPCYLPLDGGAIFATVHLPLESQRSPTGVILCPPFGWDELGAHRSLRALAGVLAQAGHPALRFDLPGTGDSGGSPRDPGLLDAWTAAAATAAGWLRATSACERIVAVGVGLGGMVACRALALGAAIDDLVLWSVPAQGSMLVREMRAFARMTNVEALEHAAANGRGPSEGDGADRRAGDFTVAGFALTADTVAALESLDLTELAIADGSHRRALLLGRDTLAPDRRMREHFERSGVELTVANGPGYGSMMVDPSLAQVPRQLFARLLAWIEQGGGDAVSAAGRSATQAAAAADETDLAVGSAAIRETPFEFTYNGEILSGVLTEPLSMAEADLCVVLLNAGAVRRIGPQRMWVEAARRWAAIGVPTLRFDVLGIGDSGGDEPAYARGGSFQRPEFAGQVHAAFDELARRGLPNRFLVGGMCSGAYWGLHSALADERVRGLLLVNLLAFVWSPQLGAARDARRARALLHGRELTRVLRIVATDRWRITRMLATKLRQVTSIHRRVERQTRFADEVVEMLDQLRERDVETLLLFSLDEPLLDDFAEDGLMPRLGEWPNVHLDRIATDDHVFRPLWSQRDVHRALDDALERTLARAR